MKDKLQFLRRPWAITQDAFEILSGYDLDRCEESPVRTSIDEEDFYEKLELDEDSGIAVLELSGPIMPNPSLVARFFMGAIDSVRIEELIRDASASASVRALIIRANSPGGVVTGTPEVANAVADMVADGKPVYTFSNSLVASAMYWIAAPSTGLIGTESSRWGSVGVIRPHVDLTEARKKAGIAVEIFSSGKHKAAGAFSTSLTKEQRAAIENEVEKLGEKFRAHVSANRPAIKSEDMEALVYYGEDAKDLGYIDEIVSNFSEAFQFVQEKLSYPDDKKKNKVDTNGRNNNGAIAAINMKENQTETETDEGANAEADENKVDDSANGATDSDAENTANVDGATESESASNDDSASNENSEPTLAEISAQFSTAITEIKELRAEVATLKTEKDEAEASAERKAARIAAESGVEAADVTGSQDDAAEEEAQIASLSDSEKWEKYEEIRGEKGDADARDFYVKYLAD